LHSEHTPDRPWAADEGPAYHAEGSGAALKTTREALGLSLADIKASTGIEKSNLSRLENDSLANPTIDTLCRYAEAVGKEIVITLVDISTENA